MSRLTRIAILSCAPALVFGLTACGSSDSSSSSSAAPTTAATGSAVPSNVTAGNEEFCQSLATFDNETNLSNVDDSDNPSSAQMEQLASQIAQFNSDNAGTMPADIKPAFESLATDLQTISGNSTAQDTEQLKSAIDTIKSLKSISDWTKTNCGFDF